MKKLQISLISITLIILFINCNQKIDFKEINFEGFSILLPSSWKKIKVQGIDSDINVIVTQNKDSIYFDLGKDSQEFNETFKVFSKEQIRKYDSLKMDTKDLYSSNTPEIDQAQGTFLKEFYYYDTIENHIAKVKVPKKSGKGETGIHFTDIGKNKLTIIGKNLNTDEQIILLESFKSIKFK
jgi:hypothetical protein